MRGLAILILVLLAVWPAAARDDGRYAQSALKPWFDSLRSGRGACCSDADGTAVSDVDWESDHGRYRVRLNGEWIDVPNDAVITEPSRAGRTMVWPVITAKNREAWDKTGRNGPVVEGITIRCFMPGPMM